MLTGLGVGVDVGEGVGVGVGKGVGVGVGVDEGVGVGVGVDVPELDLTSRAENLALLTLAVPVMFSTPSFTVTVKVRCTAAYCPAVAQISKF